MEMVVDNKGYSKIEIFILILIQGVLPITEALRRKGLQIDEYCSVCGYRDESLQHVCFK